MFYLVAKGEEGPKMASGGSLRCSGLPFINPVAFRIREGPSYPDENSFVNSSISCGFLSSTDPQLFNKTWEYP